MARLSWQKDGTLTITLTLVEQDTLAGLPAGQFDEYLTLWLQERATQVFQQRFAQLSPQDQGDVLVKFRDAGKPVQVTPPLPAPPVQSPPVQVPPIEAPQVTPAPSMPTPAPPVAVTPPDPVPPAPVSAPQPAQPVDMSAPSAPDRTVKP